MTIEQIANSIELWREIIDEETTQARFDLMSEAERVWIATEILGE